MLRKCAHGCETRAQVQGMRTHGQDCFGLARYYSQAPTWPPRLPLSPPSAQGTCHTTTRPGDAEAAAWWPMGVIEAAALCAWKPAAPASCCCCAVCVDCWRRRHRPRRPSQCGKTAVDAGSRPQPLTPQACQCQCLPQHRRRRRRWRWWQCLGFRCCGGVVGARRGFVVGSPWCQRWCWHPWRPASKSAPLASATTGGAAS